MLYIVNCPKLEFIYEIGVHFWKHHSHNLGTTFGGRKYFISLRENTSIWGKLTGGQG